MNAARGADWAILRTGGKQYRVSQGQVLKIERSSFFAAAATEADGTKFFVFHDVLAVSVGGSMVIGKPLVRGARITTELLPEDRRKKVLVFKKRRRKNSRRMAGHRQWFQPIRVLAIDPGEAGVGLQLNSPAQAAEALPFETRPDLAVALANTRRGIEGAAAALARRTLVTRWFDFPASDRMLVADALRPYSADDWATVGRLVTLALEKLRHSEQSVTMQSAVPKSRAPQLSLEVVRVENGAGSSPILRARGAILSPGDRRLSEAASGGTRLRPEVTVSGPGLSSGAVSLVHRNGTRPGVEAEFAVRFHCKPGHDPVVLTVQAGMRTLRRFINPETLEVSRTPPMLLNDETSPDQPL